MTIKFSLGKPEILNFVTAPRPMTTPKIILLLKILTISMQRQSYDIRLPQQVVGENYHAMIRGYHSKLLGKNYHAMIRGYHSKLLE